MTVANRKLKQHTHNLLFVSSINSGRTNKAGNALNRAY